MRYRPDIDGLRCIAVLPVVLFHVGVPGFPGGFIGVDIFFVISGYLITATIAEEIRSDTFTVTGFYERRIRRIFPALIVMLAVAALAAVSLLFPQDLVAFARSVVATALFGSNMLFWHQSGYFAAPAAASPLLHTWSLAVEEQFYIFFPIGLWLLWRWHAKHWARWVAAITVVSFALSAWSVRDHAAAAFYLLPTRAWELLLGSLLALEVFPTLRSRALREIAGAIGLALIAWGLFRLNSNSKFPGPNALYPCLGAALLIWIGASTTVGRLVAAPPLRWIGLISYSLYLWHWPLIVFSHQAGLWVFTPTVMASIIAASMAMAWASWKFVETPFRQRRRFDRRQIFAFGLGGMTLISLIGAAGAVSSGLPWRLPERALAIARYGSQQDPHQRGCPSSKGTFDAAKLCARGANTPPHFALWGDSHAGALWKSFAEAAGRHDQSVQLIEHVSCPPIVGVGRIDDRSCAGYNASAFEYLQHSTDIGTVILAARYAYYLYGGTTDFGPAEATYQKGALLADASRRQLSAKEAEALFTAQVRVTVDGLVRAGKRVVIIYPVPETGYDIPRVLSRLVILGDDPEAFTRPVDYFRTRQQVVIQTFDALGSQVLRVRPDEMLCDATRCVVFRNGVPLYKDDDHLSGPGADMVAAKLEPIFSQTPAAVALPAAQ